jgi:hypothetical protein
MSESLETADGAREYYALLALGLLAKVTGVQNAQDWKIASLETNGLYSRKPQWR